VKLQKQLSRKTQDREYPKWVIVIPPKVVEKLGWEEGEVLRQEVRNNKLILQSEVSK
jgi:bifunctional DNA-binding transcriptional regulator/antitoxin component of YhaV-PrlF toxin-antitoxin module